MSHPSDDDQRAALMRALSTAEHVTSTTPVLPTWIRIQDDQGSARLDIYFHRAPGKVSAFAHAYGVKTTSMDHHGTGPGSQIYTEATGRINDVPFCAWSMSDAAPEDGKHAELRHTVFALDADSKPVPAFLPVPTSMLPPESDAPENDERAVETRVGADRLVTRYRARDGQEFVHTGEFTPYGVPLYQEAGVDLPREQQVTASKLGRHLGRLTPVETAPAATA